MVRFVRVLALLFLAGSQPALAHPPALCSERGTDQRPRLRPGIYQVATDPVSGVAHLYYVDPDTDAKLQIGDASWDLTTGITRLGRWLYIVSEGKLHRVNPETGEWFPKPLDVGGACAWYIGWPGPIWARNNALYAIKPNPNNPNEMQIQRLDFDAATSKIVERFFQNRIEVH